MKLEDLSLIKTLGVGGFGRVELVSCINIVYVILIASILSLIFTKDMSGSIIVLMFSENGPDVSSFT